MTGSTGTGRTGHSGKGNTGSTGDTGAASVRAYAAITLQSLITGFSFMFLKIALQSADTFDLLAHRFTLRRCPSFSSRSCVPVLSGYASVIF